jgi:hypothetical protein
VKVAVELVTLLHLSETWSSIASPRSHPVLALVQEAGGAIVATTIAEPDHGGVPDLSLASACKFCDRTYPPQPRLDRFQPTTDLGNLGKRLHRETLAQGELPACVRRAMGTTRPGRRSLPDRTDEAAYRFGDPPGLAGWPAGLDPARIWLGPARSRPAPPVSFLFLLC